MAGSAAKVAAALLLLVLVSNANLIAEQSDMSTMAPKSIAAGVVLGALGLSSVPGSYGWGNFYAGDYRGFAILNLGGSICASVGYLSAFFLVMNAFTGDYEEGGALELLAIAGIGGAYGFGLASAIWGGLAVAAYNEGGALDHRVAERGQLVCRALPSRHRLALEIGYLY